MHRADTDECCLDSKVWTTKEMENIKLWEDENWREIIKECGSGIMQN